MAKAATEVTTVRCALELLVPHPRTSDEATVSYRAKHIRAFWAEIERLQREVDRLQTDEVERCGRRDDVAAEIVAKMTPRGAWTRKTLATWGVPWPPPAGWRRHLEKHGFPYRQEVGDD